MKRTEILAKALKCFSIHGYFGCSMKQIADSVGINKATLYHYYESKQELFLAVFDIQMNNFVSSFKLIANNFQGEPFRSVISSVTHRLVSSSTLDQITFIKNTQIMLASNAGDDFIRSLSERLSQCNMDVYYALRNRLLSSGLDMQQYNMEKFLASYFIFLNGFLDWVLLNANIGNQDVATQLDLFLDAFWQGCESMLPSYETNM